MPVSVKDGLIEVLKKQDSLLDSMLKVQKEIHENIHDKNWVELEKNIHESKLISDSFVEQDTIRETLAKGNNEIYYSKEVEPYLLSVRSKLSRSKVENAALSAYVDTTRKFIDSFVDDCVGVKKATVYSPKGMVKPELSSVMVNTVF